MRTKLPYSSSFFSFSQNTDCNTSPYLDCSFTGTHYTPSESAAFENCHFTNMKCTNGKGGAISCEHSSVSISLSSCIFESCSSIDRGGAVYVSGESNTLTVTQSLFRNCITTKKTNEQYPGGGGVCVIGSSSSLTIRTCIFIDCQANVEPRGGGAFFTSQMKESYTFSSRFISCSTANAGGAIFFYELTDEFSVSDSLFSMNSAQWGGGAIRELSNTKSNYIHIYFSFFTQNLIPTERGTDFSVYPKISNIPFSCCFSTASVNRVSIAIGFEDAYIPHDNWLPLTNSAIKMFDPHQTANKLSNDKRMYDYPGDTDDEYMSIPCTLYTLLDICLLTSSSVAKDHKNT